MSQNPSESDLQFWQHHLENARASGDLALEAVALTNLGALYDCSGQYNQALELYHQGRLIFRSLGDRRQEIWALNNIGTTYGKLGQYDKAIEAYLSAITISRLEGRLVREGWVLKNLGHTYCSMGQYDEAVEAFQQAIEVFQNTKSLEELAEVTQLLQKVQQERDRR